MENTLTSIGYTGCMKCYLNVEEKEAIERYCISEDITLEEFNNTIGSVDILEFDDEFEAYAVWNSK